MNSLKRGVFIFIIHEYSSIHEEDWKQVERAITKALKEAKADNRAKGIGKQAVKKEVQDALKLNEKTYKTICALWALPDAW